MKKFITRLPLLLFTMVVFAGCKKDNDGETKTQLLTKSSWRFDKATASLAGDISGEIDECIKDNTITFTATSENMGTGVIDEGATTCNSSSAQTINFTWTLENNGNTLVSSEPLIPGGSTEFTVEELNSTSLVISQSMTISPFPATTVTVYLKH